MRRIVELWRRLLRRIRQSFNETRRVYVTATSDGGVAVTDHAVADATELDLSASSVVIDHVCLSLPTALTTILEEHPCRQEVQRLCVTNCQLSQLSLMVGAFQNLTVLSVASNSISSLPWSLVYLKKLEELDVSDNELTQLPRTIGHLSQLRSLNANYNCLEYLPTELLSLPRLRRVAASENPIISPPPDVCAKGIVAIMDYLRQRQQRKNQWEGWQPWVGGVRSGLGTDVPSLLDTCVNCVLKHNIDFLQVRYFPPTLKTHLSHKDTERRERHIELMKCSSCSAYFSNQMNFEKHVCKRVCRSQSQRVPIYPGIPI